MSFKTAGTLVTSAAGTATFSVTVPAGVVATDTGFFAFTGSVTGPTSVTATKAGAQIATYRTDTGVWNAYAASPATSTTVATGLTTTTNEWHIFYKMTGLVAGDTVVFAPNVSQVAQVHSMYFTNDLTPTGAWAVKAATTIVAPSVSGVAVGQRTFFFCTSRATTGMTLSSVTNSNGLTVTTDYSHLDATTQPAIIAHLFDVVPTGTSTGTVTATYNTSNTNGGGFGFAEVVPASTAIRRPPTVVNRAAIMRANF